MDEALKQLHDLHLPAQPGLWPPAPGWWLFAAALFGLCVWFGLRWYRTQQRRRPFRVAIGMLDRLLVRARNDDVSALEFADAVNSLLKRALLHGANRLEAAPLTGAAWLAYLDRIVANNTFSSGRGAALGDDRFTPEFHGDAVGLHAAATHVLRALLAEKRVQS